MKEYGKQRSTVKPLELELTETKVFVNSDIVQVNEPGTDEQPGFTGYEFTLTEYEKDEYIKLQAEKNESLQQQWQPWCGSRTWKHPEVERRRGT